MFPDDCNVSILDIWIRDENLQSIFVNRAYGFFLSPFPQNQSMRLNGLFNLSYSREHLDYLESK